MAHLIIFLKPDGKLTDGPEFLPQTYVAAISTFLVNAFGTSLVVSLGFASRNAYGVSLGSSQCPSGPSRQFYGIRWSPLLLFDRC